MPETAEYSVVMAIHTLWLAARAEGIAWGWLSILDPLQVAKILDVPPSGSSSRISVSATPKRSHETPLLEREGWERRRPTATTLLKR